MKKPYTVTLRTNADPNRPWLDRVDPVFDHGLVLRHFTPTEFRRPPGPGNKTYDYLAEIDVYWGKAMWQPLLLALDEFREQWGFPVVISPAPGAIGRLRPPTETSQHNLLRWGVVRAIDVMPVGMLSRADARRAVEIAAEVGMDGIGLYPHWKPRAGLHLDMREEGGGRWGGVLDEDGNQVMVALDTALEEFPDG